MRSGAKNKFGERFYAENMNKNKDVIIVLDESLSGINVIYVLNVHIIKKTSSSVIMVSHHSMYLLLQ